MLGLYLHIPFCQAICSYCNFARGLHDAALAHRYVDAVAREIGLAGDGRAADTIFFGGGTPSLLAPHDVGRLVSACRQTYAVTADAEVTLETNPETVTARHIEALLEAGVTRIGLGVQSFDDDELRRLGRVHSAARALEAVEAIRAAGCSNVSLDLMLWLPGQSRDSWRRTIERAIGAAPHHLSLYLLELYPNAPLQEAMARARHAPAGEDGQDDWVQIAEDEAADMYLDGLGQLDTAGYEQYEISNVARPGFASRHNLKYWRSGAWRGFGCAAHSTLDGYRWRNITSTAEYVARLEEGRPVTVGLTALGPQGRVEEALFTGLRLATGIDEASFSARFGWEPWARYGDALGPLVHDGIVWRAGGRFGLTRRGMLVANDVLSLFV